MKIKIKGVYAKHCLLASGITRTYIYHRATSTRLPDNPEPPSFTRRSSGSGRASDDPAAEGTVHDLIRRYLASGAFSSKEKGTRSEYRRHCATIEASGIAEYAVKDIRRKHVSAILDQHQDRPAKADALRRQFSLLWSHAVEELGWIEVHPLTRMKSRRANSRKDEGQRPLEEDEIDAVREANPLGSRARLVFETELGTALRRSDAAKVTAAQFRSRKILLLTTKTGEQIVAAPTAMMIAAFDAFDAFDAGEELAGRPIGRYVMRGATDAPLHPRTIGADIETAFQRAKLPPRLRSHALRYTAAVRLLELGFNFGVVAELCGHRMSGMAQKYVAKRRNPAVRASVFDAVDGAFGGAGRPDLGG